MNIRAARIDSPVRVRGLTKRYAEHEVLAGVDLDLAPGETYALLGPNGAGKSTMIEILEGLRTPSSGDVRVLGHRPLETNRAWRARIGIVGQETGDLGPFTAKELLVHFGGLYPNPRSSGEVLDLVGLTEHSGKRAAKLSGGQKRRLDVALGIIGRPELLFLDEPTTGFDPEARRQFWTMLKGLSADGTAILLTTHYLDEAAHLADRVGVLSGGRIVAEAPPELLGGKEARTPIVKWRGARGVRREVRTDSPGQFVAQLCSKWPMGEPDELQIVRPTLEDVYLDLTGTPTKHSRESGNREFEEAAS